MYKRYTSFTLAEVLITLAILGVVAAITIPSMINNINNEKLATSLKKEFSTLSQATQLISNDNGGSLKGLCNDNDNNCLRDWYGRYLKNMKSCDKNASLDICWHNNSGTRIAYWLNGSAVNSWPGSLAVGITADGAFVRYSDVSKDCLNDFYGNLKETIGCGRIVIDVNGFNQPNIVGRDIFYFALLKNRLAPYSIDLTGFTCDTTSSSGQGCTAKVLQDGAINY